MSYILDALKKSKQERQGEEAPHLHVVHAAPSLKTHSSKNGGSVLLVGGLLMVLGLVGLVYYFALSKPSSQIENPSNSVTVRAIEIRSHFFEQAEEATVVVQNSEFVLVSSTSIAESDQPVRITSGRFKKIVTGPVKSIGAAFLGEFQDLPYRVDLPSEVQREIPKFNFAGHTYADDPKRRMIIINNQILREGDGVDSDTTLVSIVWEGVVLKYKGLEFRQKIH